MNPKNAQLFYWQEQLGKINALQCRMYRNPHTGEQKMSNLILGDKQTTLIREMLQNDLIPVVDEKTGFWKLFNR